MQQGFRHDALLYAGDEQFLAATSSFIRAGVARGEPTLVVVSAHKIGRLRAVLGRDADEVLFADMAEVGHNPARIIPAWQDFVAAHAAAETPVRGIGEPIGPERGADELVECQRHESLLNLAFGDAHSFWLMCPYDTELLEPSVIEEARRSHPFVVDGPLRDSSRDYAGAAAFAAPFVVPLREAPGDAAELRFDGKPLDSVRRFVAGHAEARGLAKAKVFDLVLAVNELATNSVRHGGGGSTLRIWGERGRVLCEISDAGRLADPLADRERPPAERTGGRGFWIANGLCDLVQVRSGPAGTVVRVHMATA